MHGKRFLAALRFSLACLLLLWAAGCAGHWFTGEPPAPVPVTILFFNDLHGHLQPFEIKDGNLIFFRCFGKFNDQIFVYYRR